MARVPKHHMLGAMLSTTLNSRLGQIADDMADEVSDVLKEQAEKIAETARANAPVGTAPDPHPGRLRDSIGVVESKRGAEVGWRVIADARTDKNVPYAHMVEYGTSASNKRRGSTPAQPFLLPAFEQHREETIDAVADVLDDLG